RDSQAQLAKSAKVGQAPKAIVLSCIDSRVPVETIFDMGVGDIFVARVAGNVVNDDMLASMEYACKYIGSKVVLVLGHESCGAVNAACAGLEDGNLTELMHKIHPAVELASAEGGDPLSKEFQSRAVAYNVDVMVDNIRKNSKTLYDLESSGEIKIVGGVFDIHTGLVEFDY
ncbi:MAG: carbonic anhydrase, partial [Rikenellaceae bacterium]